MPDQTESRVAISAPPEKVMTVIADLEAYPQWNAEVRSVQVLSRHGGGRPHEARFELDATPIRDTYVLAYEWDGDARVRWSLREGQVLSAMDGSYELTPRDGTTDVTYRLAVDLKLPLLALFKRKAERIVVDRALQGLKRRVES